MELLLGILTFFGALVIAVAIIFLAGAFSIWFIDLIQNLLRIN